ncbi:alkaline ceramidase-like protein [Lophiotrema nucula]|uniref:Alkaline ceramidase-like protein n=1 Tax=Lophiotrema nucula TaxID=690887 RepID=A0A6A5ZNR6_9PLEO|nr:alkaline ceramidase-like protein [Lophiotrema nucula]
MAANLLSRLPSIPYGQPKEGKWSPVTSTLNWCEEDYVMTVWAAEIVNTTTNFLFMWLAARGIRNCLSNGHDRIFLIAYIGYLLVGTGSFFFHMTLKYPMQLVDELSMIYTTSLMVYATCTHRTSASWRISLAVFLFLLDASVTAYYHYLQDPTFHQVAYAALTAFVFFRSLYVMEVNIRPKFRSEERKAAIPRPSNGVKAVQERQDDRDYEILRKMWKMIACGLGIFLGGFAMWQLDIIFCSTLVRWRRNVGLPWGILLEGHGWWHLMTGIGAYFYVQWNIWLRYCLNFRQDDVKLMWPQITDMPLVVRQTKPYANGRGSGNQNGSAKKNA